MTWQALSVRPYPEVTCPSGTVGQGGAVQVDSIKTQVESVPGFSA
jgi:hypothetical protein